MLQSRTLWLPCFWVCNEINNPTKEREILCSSTPYLNFSHINCVIHAFACSQVKTQVVHDCVSAHCVIYRLNFYFPHSQKLSITIIVMSTLDLHVSLSDNLVVMATLTLGKYLVCWLLVHGMTD